MRSYLIIPQIIIALLLSLMILVQVKGTGFGRVWGEAVSFTRRGLEKLVFRLTFFVSLLFILVSILQIFF